MNIINFPDIMQNNRDALGKSFRKLEKLFETKQSVPVKANITNAQIIDFAPKDLH